MRRKTWAVGSALAVATIGVAFVVVKKTANAQASRPQVPRFEPDPSNARVEGSANTSR